MKARVHFI